MAIIVTEKRTFDMVKQNKMKTLYKLSRNILFNKTYFCIYCGMMDFNKEWLTIHIRNFHDDAGKITSLFQCKLCNQTINENEIVNHIIQCHT